MRRLLALTRRDGRIAVRVAEEGCRRYFRDRTRASVPFGEPTWRWLVIAGEGAAIEKAGRLSGTDMGGESIAHGTRHVSAFRRAFLLCQLAIIRPV